jgi:hypothetical protein
MRLAVRFLLERRHSELVVSEAVDGADAIEKAKERTVVRPGNLDSQGFVF